MTAYTEEEILLQVDNVSKEYEGKLVLKNVNAVIRDIKVAGTVKGQVVGFLGPSGIGKTTLFRIMAGLETPSGGRVVLDGTERAVKAGEVGVVAQNYPLFAHRTVLGNLMRAARKRYPAKEAGERVIAYLNEFDLAPQAHSYPSQLSGGQRQRCAVIQQVLSADHFILMDEPFSGLDPLAKKKTEHLIQRVADLDERNTIVIVTHDIAAAVGVADHLWLMGRHRDPEGKIIPGASIVSTYNLIDYGLAWDQEIASNPAFAPMVKEITELFGSL